MKVLLLNGSSNLKGCTYTALEEIAKTLQEEGIDTEIFQIGAEPLRDCIGTPVYYAHPSGRIMSFLDRAFYSGGAAFRFKPGMAVASARRAGTTASLDAINKYFGINQMPTVGSTYWNMVHGNRPEEVRQDLEGLQTMRNAAKCMAWMLKCFEAGKAQNIALPDTKKEVSTNFIR